MSILSGTTQPTDKWIRSIQTFLAKPRLAQRVWRKFLSLFFSEQWIILISTHSDSAYPAWEDFKPLMPPPGRAWADPFPWVHEGRYYIFVEELLHPNGRGHIACLSLDDQFNVVSSRIVLQQPYHLSYPYLFSYQGELYMMPETKENCSIEVYRCEQFPDCWTLEKTLMTNIHAVDATLFEQNDRWWLFVNIQEPNNHTWDTLNLYYSDNPFSEQWTPYAGNPIVKDVKTARSAGRIFSVKEKLFRPSQDCSVRYGYAINFNQITQLTETGYTEKQEQTFKPPSQGNIMGTHTWNQSGDLRVIDAILRHRKF